MPKTSAFTPCGHLRFSSRPSHGEQIYRDKVANLGGEDNYSNDFDSPAMARVYADSMAHARVLNTIERAGAQFRPERCVELLPNLEHEYGLIPDPDERIRSRQDSLAAAARIARGAKRTNIQEVMSLVMGDHSVAYLTTAKEDAVLSTNAPETKGVYAKPGTPRSAFRTLDPIATIGTPVTVRYQAITGASATLAVGDRFVIDVANYGRIEAVTVTSVTTVGDVTAFVATFTKPHDLGVVVATGRHPHQMSTKRHNVFVLSAEAARSPRLRARANRTLRKLLRGVSTWTLTEETSPGVSGPFKVGNGKIGITTIGEVTQ